MISLFSGKNYKAFESFEMQIKPITILLGANSCGKSALINALLMLSQSIDTMDISESALRLNGKKIGMGEALNLIKNKEKNNKLSFKFTFDKSGEQKINGSTFQYDFIESQVWTIRAAYFGLRKISDVNIAIDRDIVTALETELYQSEKPDINKIVKLALSSMKELKKSKSDYNKQKINNSRYDNTINYLFNLSQKKFKDSMLELASVDDNLIELSSIEYTFSYNSKVEGLYISDFKIFNTNDDIILQVYYSDEMKFNIRSDIFCNRILKNSKGDLAKIININSLSVVGEPRFNRRLKKSTNNPVVEFIISLISLSVNRLFDELKDLKINHVSPLRALPQRYYLLDKSIHHNQLNSLDGTELAEVLKKNPKIKNEINKLLAQFRIAIDIEKVNDIIHKITVNQNTVNLELTDVGFGISQVLPILVQAMLSPEESITIIEQPEIHLHPNMQAWLTDALIDIALKSKKYFIIETHSDALIRRVRLRIVDKDWSLTEKDVAIYHLEQDKLKSQTNLNSIPVNSVGELTWPTDFMDVEIKDTIEYQRKKIDKLISEKSGE
ncbi:TPA: AAA family ATPase [Morganella morganii]